MLNQWSREPLRVNPGRPATRIGGDGIHPYLDVPHPQTCGVLRLLRRHRIPFQVQYAFARQAEAPDLDRATDRVSFPENSGPQIQGLLDQVRGFEEP